MAICLKGKIKNVNANNSASNLKNHSLTNTDNNV